MLTNASSKSGGGVGRYVRSRWQRRVIRHPPRVQLPGPTFLEEMLVDIGWSLLVHPCVVSIDFLHFSPQPMNPVGWRSNPFRHSRDFGDEMQIVAGAGLVAKLQGLHSPPSRRRSAWTTRVAPAFDLDWKMVVLEYLGR